MKILTVALLFLSFLSVGQRHHVQIKLEKVQDPESLLEKIKTLDLLSIDAGSKEILTLTFDESKLRSLEGMSSSVQGKGAVKIHLASPSLSWDSTWTFTAAIKAKNKWEASGHLAQAFEEQELENSLEVINAALDDLYARNCATLLNRGKAALKRSNFKEAYSLAVRSAVGQCTAEAEQFKRQVETAYGADFCNTRLPKIKILASSGNTQQMEKAIEELYGFPLNAPCADEVQGVAKSVGELIAKMPPKEKTHFTTILVQGLSLYQIFGLQ